MVEVDDEVAGIARRKGVLMDAGAFGGGELGLDAVIAKQDGVVARSGGFILVGEAGPVAGGGIIARAGVELVGPGAGHEEDIEHVADAGTAQVGVAKAHDGGVGIVIAGAPVPTFVVSIGTELHHPEGDAGSGVRVAVAAGTDEDVDVAGGVNDR
jgi:hypothetical protein